MILYVNNCTHVLFGPFCTVSRAVKLAKCILFKKRIINVYILDISTNEKIRHSHWWSTKPALRIVIFRGPMALLHVHRIFGTPFLCNSMEALFMNKPGMEKSDNTTRTVCSAYCCIPSVSN